MITVIGGINADIEGRPYADLRARDSNPGKIKISYGGVGRNIAENLARMGTKVSLISAAGNDFLGREAVHRLNVVGVNTDYVQLEDKESTAMYISILDTSGDMELGLCNMEIFERITRDRLDECMGIMLRSSMVAIDTNLTESNIDYLTQRLTAAGIPIFLDPVSLAKAGRAKPFIGRFHTIKPNLIEAEELCGMKIDSEESLREAGRLFAEKGVRQVFISLSEKGVYYKSGECKAGHGGGAQPTCAEGIIRPSAGLKIVSATGAGDAFSAAVLACFEKGLDIEETVRTGMAASAIAMEADVAVNPQMSCEELYRRISR